jgi:glutathione synthase
MRTDPPVDATTCMTPNLLTLAQRAGALVVNDPQGSARHEREADRARIPAVLPPTAVSRGRRSVLKAFIAEHGEAVLKTLDGMGGRSIFRADPAIPTRTSSSRP